MQTKFTRSKNDKVIAGICGGLARSLGWNVGPLRILVVIVAILTAVFPALIIYAVLSFVIPEE
jgi:phage shock protein PspC (stress-responsive transcriptional regulator)